MIDEIYASMDKDGLLLRRVKVIDNQLYFENVNREKVQSNPIEDVLRFFIRTVGLPDLDFVLTLHDSCDSLPLRYDPYLHSPKIRK
jgi:hypothetical protein